MSGKILKIRCESCRGHGGAYEMGEWEKCEPCNDEGFINYKPKGTDLAIVEQRGIACNASLDYRHDYLDSVPEGARAKSFMEFMADWQGLRGAKL